MPRRAGYDTTGLTFLIDVETLRLSCVKMRYCALPATECNEPTSHFPMFTCLNYGCEGTLVLPKIDCTKWHTIEEQQGEEMTNV
ncbi:hypothetical protein OUZ56_013175 [Daphnia magna]|uniref:Uncharacterized protein n=1 Tax=Daphnia magna TaxID=35525 RepID=A0ABQ9Z530_9CRUS|nr:hypothetical protein OUZ56_013175 [Daphnia magna]